MELRTVRDRLRGGLSVPTWRSIRGSSGVWLPCGGWGFNRVFRGPFADGAHISRGTDIQRNLFFAGRADGLSDRRDFRGARRSSIWSRAFRRGAGTDAQLPHPKPVRLGYAMVPGRLRACGTILGWRRQSTARRVRCSCRHVRGFLYGVFICGVLTGRPAVACGVAAYARFGGSISIRGGGGNRGCRLHLYESVFVFAFRVVCGPNSLFDERVSVCSERRELRQVLRRIPAPELGVAADLPRCGGLRRGRLSRRGPGSVGGVLVRCGGFLSGRARARRLCPRPPLSSVFLARGRADRVVAV